MKAIFFIVNENFLWPHYSGLGGPSSLNRLNPRFLRHWYAVRSSHFNHSTITCMQMTHNFSSLSTHPIFTLASPTSRLLYKKFLLGSMTANLLTLSSSKTEFLLIGLKQQLAKIQNCSLSTTHSARNLGFIFDEHLSFSDQITALSKSCNFHIRQLRCVRPFLDIKTTSTIATSIVLSKLDSYNSQYYNLPNSQLPRLQHIQNSLARVVVKAPKFSHTIPILKSLKS